MVGGGSPSSADPPPPSPLVRRGRGRPIKRAPPTDMGGVGGQRQAATPLVGGDDASIYTVVKGGRAALAVSRGKGGDRL